MIGVSPNSVTKSAVSPLCLAQTNQAGGEGAQWGGKDTFRKRETRNREEEGVKLRRIREGATKRKEN